MTAAAGLLAGFLLPLLGLACAAWALGRAVTRRAALDGDGPALERAVVAFALGLALAAHLLLLLGLAGWLRPGPVLAAAVGVGLWSWWGRGKKRPQGPQGSQGPQVKAKASEVPGVPGVAAVPFFFFAALLPLALLALYPPTGFDATLYHLPFARAFAESGGVPYVMDRRVPVFPQANEVLFAALLLFGRDVATQGLQLLATLASAGLAFSWARRAWPGRRWAGWLAAATFLGNPIVVHLGGSAYIEPGLTLFVTAALYSLDRWSGERRWGWLALAAVFAATASDTKYLGLFFLGVAGLYVLLSGGRSRPIPARLRDALVFTGVALVFLAPWYLRIVLFNGNPLFPYLTGIFGVSAWNPAHPPEFEQPHGQHLLRWLRLPWDLVFRRQAYNQQPFFSPVYLAALPLLALGAFRERRVRLALVVIGVYAFIFTFLPPDGRYLVPLLPLAGVAIAGSLATVRVGWDRRNARNARNNRIIAALCLAAFLPGWLYAGYRIGRQGPIPVTAGQRDAYLARKLPAYPALAFLNRTRGRAYTVWALHLENMAYFADGRYLGDWFGPASYPGVLAGARTPADLHARLRRLGADHLLLGSAKEGLPFPEDAGFRRWFAPVYADPAARLYELRPMPAIRSSK